MTAATLCELHNLPVYGDGKAHRGACLICDTVDGECDFGGCTRAAVVAVACRVDSRATARERRPACAMHACEIGASYQRLGYLASYETEDGRVEYTGNQWRPWSSLHSDAKLTRADGSRLVMTNIAGLGTCLSPWSGPRPRRAH